MTAAADIAARLAVYAVLASLVLAAFAMPLSRGSTVPSAQPVAETDRVAPVARSLPRADISFDMGVTASEPAASVPAAPAGEAPAVSASATTEPPPAPPTAKPTASPPPPAPAPPAPAPSARLAPIEDGVAAAEARMLALINGSRAAAGLGSLLADAAVAAVARLHSAAEARAGYVYHDGPDGTARSRNAPACGNGWYGENTGKIWSGDVARLHNEFMAEPGVPIDHRYNILDRTFSRIGIGAVLGRDAMYMTMVFCR